MTSTRYWAVSSTIDAMRQIGDLMDRVPPAYVVEVAKMDSAAASAFHANNFADPVTGLKKPLPSELISRPQKLIIRDLAFSQDYVNQGGIFVSARLRKIFDLPPDTVQYIKPDTSGSTENVVAMDYRWMGVLVTRDAIDLDRSERVELPGLPGSHGPALKRVVFREDFEADVPLFQVAHDQRLYATDAFAEQVLSAGAIGIEFYDPWSSSRKME